MHLWRNKILLKANNTRKRKRKDIHEPFNVDETVDGIESSAGTSGGREVEAEQSGVDETADKVQDEAVAEASGNKQPVKRQRCKHAYCVNRDKFWVQVSIEELNNTVLELTGNEDNDELVHRVIQHKIRYVGNLLGIFLTPFLFFDLLLS